jgi:heterodisulfide reductase subunit A
MTDRRVLVLGGGIAGVAAALDLAEAGVAVTLVEKDDFLGGHAASLACKALDACQHCNVCLAEPRFRQVLNHQGITILTRSSLQGLERREQGLIATILQQPAYIDPARCSGCGLCLQACPAAAEGALRRPPLPGQRPPLAIDTQACLYFRDGRSTLCRDICPEEAIDFSRQPRQLQIEAQALVLATGFKPYPAQENTRLGYGQLPNVITALELEAGLRASGRPLRPSDGQLPQRVAFIQCVGSRQRLGHNYCSRVCCAYGLRLGRLLKARFDAQVSVFYMDLQSFGQVPDDFLAAARQELELIRCLPYDALAGPRDSVYLEYQPQDALGTVSRAFDLLVLCVGLTPGVDNGQLAACLGLALDQHGFITGAPGLFVAGTATGPMDLAESLASAGRAAHETLRYLEAH